MIRTHSRSNTILFVSDVFKSLDELLLLGTVCRRHVVVNVHLGAV